MTGTSRVPKILLIDSNVYFSKRLTDALKKDAVQELIVSVYDPTDGGPQPRGKQVMKPGGIYYTAVTGIWQTVWLEPMPKISIRSAIRVKSRP